jgi:prepilin-type N-terminal cleavage/methylation domain-containing protein
MQSHHLFYSVSLKRGFTLVELLISLTVLGLVAALTVPAVIESVARNRRSAVIRETINILQNAMTECVNDGSCNGTNINGMYKKINAVKQCNSGDGTACRTESTLAVGGAGQDAGFIFQNGAYVWGLNRTFAATTYAQPFVLDTNGLAKPNAVGRDIMWLVRCFDPVGNGTNCIGLDMPDGRHGKIDVLRSNANSLAMFNAAYGL